MTKKLDKLGRDLLARSSKRQQSVTSDWEVLRDLIAGVQYKEVRNVIKNTGYITELYRADWEIDDTAVEQVFQVLLNPGVVEAWHIHSETTDRFFVSSGRVLIVLYDDREGSPTRGQVNEFRVGIERPALISVPPGIWHGVKNIGEHTAMLVNLVDKAYVYESPDHRGLPQDMPDIPYYFSGDS
jgi:dTDP-4-dehydrorhamnose 3,5-epimerase